MSTNVCLFGKGIDHDITMMLHECHGAFNHQSLHYLFNRFPSSKYIPLIKTSNMDNFAMPWRLYDAMVQQNCTIDQSHRCGRRQAACREPVGSYDKTTRTAICFEHKTQYLLIRAPYTRIVVFWYISNIPPMVSQSQISCNTPTFCIAAIFVKYCYTTGSWLL